MQINKPTYNMDPYIFEVLSHLNTEEVMLSYMLDYNVIARNIIVEIVGDL